MDVTINIFGIGGIVVLAILIGYFMGRNERGGVQEEEDAVGEIRDAAEAKESSSRGEERGHNTGRHRPSGNRQILRGRSIASPVTGRIELFAEGGRKGVVIKPDQGRIYAPVSGKIIKLYPMGNAFVLRSNEQYEPIELLIRVGRKQPDELCSMYFRCCVVQNEIVNKGKLLLEFDMENLSAAGEDVCVTVCPAEGMTETDIVITQEENVKVGEEIFKTY